MNKCGIQEQTPQRRAPGDGAADHAELGLAHMPRRLLDATVIPIILLMNEPCAELDYIGAFL